ncbi:MAG: hypothetical protein JRF55_00075 [Deltaproteobacteria bacterium]|nr:hypothetical protein [Deltaproteobacteria bacterium]
MPRRASVRELVPIGDDEGHTLRGAWIGGDTPETARGRIGLREPSRDSCVDYETGFIEELGQKYAASADFPGTVYVDSPEYREIRSQIMSGAHEACRVSAESSR